MAEPVAATHPFTITLEAQQWNAVIGTLVKGPYEVVAPLIQTITQQLQQQQTTNGADATMPYVPPPITTPH